MSVAIRMGSGGGGGVRNGESETLRIQKSQQTGKKKAAT